ncbi:hypothetical protein Rsub_12739 [Raphidocelis subcapitata]|uniref:Uncharacterized protein n=1 Tax=Raphidocelis subcapitata TaxID=307507 RepID=A0A2V0PRD5_9CHLO|nr:hypothetical protein Rsub_12739 [Raphidocelis subcapitata]|eukprot:GBG00128.1 hypothetical protein Rsub_12739 [Raphidocelis subcapitata]
MACPMRFVLVGISLVVAWFAWWRSEALQEDAEAEEGSGAAGQRQRQRRRGAAAPDPKAATLPQRLRGAAATFFDMFSGAYLYRAIAHGVERRPAAAHARAR